MKRGKRRYLSQEENQRMVVFDTSFYHLINLHHKITERVRPELQIALINPYKNL